VGAARNRPARDKAAQNKAAAQGKATPSKAAPSKAAPSKAAPSKAAPNEGVRGRPAPARAGRGAAVPGVKAPLRDELPAAVLPRWVRVVGGVLVSAGAVESAILEVFYAPLRIGTVLIPVAVLAAGVLNLLLPKLMYAATASRWAAVVPALLWLIIVVGLSVGRPEGDVLLPGDWVGLLLLFGGAAAAAFGVARAIPPRQI
jgi:hypothetical protein